MNRFEKAEHDKQVDRLLDAIFDRGPKMPDDFSVTRAESIRWAADALTIFRAAVIADHPKECDVPEGEHFAYLLSSLRHLADAKGFSWAQAKDRAEAWYRDEKPPEHN
jgi:hypothetical protein